MAVNAPGKKSNVSPRVRTIITITLLLLTIISPLIGLVGVVVMWARTTWKKWVKILVTIPFFTVYILGPVLVLIYSLSFRPFQMSGLSMSPTYKSGEYLVTRIVNHKELGINRKDVIVFISPHNSEEDLIKRVIGLPGETVMVQEGNLIVNGQRLDESQYVSSDVKTYGGPFLGEGQTVTVPAGHYFVLGDNRPSSFDSRQWGFVPKENIISKVSFCLWNCK